ncbi:Alpha/Beta hydrolase protein [Podospora didyma]|uniref:Carboxylic ester hydrolase n=1 Tax=Podospora didyma TaxID=330526 RepID=A0AAE0U8W1_9PEZI|nr:Alpha/Beta hydrolase protein [Podospora didyma]
MKRLRQRDPETYFFPQIISSLGFQLVSKMYFLHVLLAVPSLAIAATKSVHPLTEQLTVKTITGTYTGLVDDAFPHVRQFRSIPYAEPPLGNKRWQPPIAAAPSLRRSYAYRFPPSCPQYQSKNLTAWNTNITDFSIQLYGQSHSAGAMAQASSEDCLYLAVWTPFLNPNLTARDTKLPVALFIPGGSWVTGGVDVPYQKPAAWIERTLAHIVVTANYRVNIAGFPWAAGLETQNLGVLDQRSALEWVYANIAAFGGDPSRITLWGHSAGGVAVDILNYAYHDNPLAAGLFMQSGTAMVNISRPDRTHSNFTFVAKNLGCDFATDPSAELSCMRQVPMAQIQNFVGQYQDNGTRPPLTFKMVPDDRTVFFNYTARTEKGLISRIPALVSTTSNEEASLYRYPASNVTAGPYQPAVDAATVDVFVCLARNTTQARKQQGVTTYRYEYAGNFSNVTPLSWMGAYHASDIPMIFGTYNTSTSRTAGIMPDDEHGLVRSQVTDFQRRVADAMQEYVLAFMLDPENGLRKRGWLPHDETVGSEVGGRNMIRFAAGGVVAQNVTAADVDDSCVLGKKYNSSP